MNVFNEQHQKLIRNLLLERVDFIIIGGYSVIFHGYKRTTGDVDIWLKPVNDNRDKVMKALLLTGFEKEDLKEISEQDFSKYLVFSIWDEPEKADFITRINLVEYEDADKQKVTLDWEGLNIPFLHLNHLILSKMNTGRLQDKADIEKLQQLQQKNKRDNL